MIRSNLTVGHYRRLEHDQNLHSAVNFSGERVEQLD